MGPRRKAREYALQMLFQWDITHDTMDQVFAVYPGGNQPGGVETRPDVVGALKNGSLLMSGFYIVIPAGTLTPGLASIQIAGAPTRHENQVERSRKL